MEAIKFAVRWGGGRGYRSLTAPKVIQEVWWCGGVKHNNSGAAVPIFLNLIFSLLFLRFSEIKKHSCLT